MPALALVALAAAGGPAAAEDPAALEAGRAADIRIALPAGEAPFVSVQPGTDRVLLDLPRGARLPEDFAEASAGLLGDSRVEFEGERVRVGLEMARGFLDRVDYEPDGIVLHFSSRFQPAAASSVGDDEQYRIGPDDKLQIRVHNQDDLSGPVVVSGEGLITAPLIGDVQASGLTPRQLAARLAERLDRTFLVDPRVDVEVEEYRSQWVIVAGEVRLPGRVALRGGTRLKEVIGTSQGFSQYAGEEIKISRKLDGSETVTLRIDRKEFESGQRNPILAHGDIVEVVVAPSCFIQGEVRDGGGKVRIERGMTLLRAIASAGGLTDWANRKSVTVLYSDGNRPKRVYNLNKIEAGRAPDPLLEGGEVIIVKKRFL